MPSPTLLGGKSTQISSWRNTLRASSSIAMAIICVVILFNLNTITLRVILIGIAAGFIGGLGLPFIYQAFSIGSVSFVSPVVALVQSFNLILFAVLVKDESISWTFPIATAFRSSWFISSFSHISKSSEGHIKSIWPNNSCCMLLHRLFSIDDRDR